MVMKTNYTQLNIEEREQIAVLKAQGKSLREIGRMLGKNHSTISRELKRNRIKEGYLAYRANDWRGKERNKPLEESGLKMNSFVTMCMKN